MKDLDIIFGPRVPKELVAKERGRFMLPTVLFALVAVMLLVSIFLPYWQLTLLAPQYPGGLSAVMYVNRLTGDINEIDGLNHYIGMRPLDHAAKLERSLSVAMIVALTLITISAIWIHSPFALFFTIPAIIYPVVFLADLYFWMRSFGMNLDPKAPLSNAVDPFVPPLLGPGNVGQFKTVASWEIGLILAIVASVLTIVGLFFHRRAYKPLLEARLRSKGATDEA